MKTSFHTSPALWNAGVMCVACIPENENIFSTCTTGTNSSISGEHSSPLRVRCTFRCDKTLKIVVGENCVRPYAFAQCANCTGRTFSAYPTRILIGLLYQGTKPFTYFFWFVKVQIKLTLSNSLYNRNIYPTKRIIWSAPLQKRQGVIGYLLRVNSRHVESKKVI